MITYKIGDASLPTLQNPNKYILITHVCNNIGAWGKGFTAALDKNIPEAKKEYQGHVFYRLGDVLLAFSQEKQIYVANMIAQEGIGRKNGIPIRYDALFEAMKTVSKMEIFNKCEIHAPRFGTGLAGGNWEIIECFIEYLWKNINVYICDFKK